MAAWFVINIATKLVFRIMFALGLGVISYIGLGEFVDIISGEISSRFSALPIDLKGVLGRAKVPQGVSIILSAHVYKFSLLVGQKFIGIRS